MLFSPHFQKSSVSSSPYQEQDTATSGTLPPPPRLHLHGPVSLGSLRMAGGPPPGFNHPPPPHPYSYYGGLGSGGFGPRGPPPPLLFYRSSWGAGQHFFPEDTRSYCKKVGPSPPLDSSVSTASWTLVRQLDLGQGPTEN